METYNLYGTVTISIYTKVEANSLDEAKEIAEHRNIEAGGFDDKIQCLKSWVSDEYDGEPQRIVDEDGN